MCSGGGLKPRFRLHTPLWKPRYSSRARGSRFVELSASFQTPNALEQVLGCGAIRSDILQVAPLKKNNRNFNLISFCRPQAAGIGDSHLLYMMETEHFAFDSSLAGWVGLSALVLSD
jgi:hypothetical protein